MRNASGAVVGTHEPRTVKLGGGGFVIGISMSNDAVTMACNTDVFGAYVWVPDNDQWEPLFAPANLQTSEYDPRPSVGSLSDGLGSIATAVAPNDNTRLYAAWNGFFYRFDRTGSAWSGVRCNLAAKRQFSNSGATRWWNDKIAVHPTDKNTALFGTFNDGVYYTTNGGVTMTAVAGIPANTTYGGVQAPYLVAIAPNGTDCYIHVQGTGLYRSTTGVSGAFSLISGSHSLCSHLLVDAGGRVFSCNPSGAAGSNVMSYSSGSWTNLPGTGLDARVYHSVAVSPQNTNRVMVVDLNGNTAFSLNGMTSWQSLQPTFPPNGTPLEGTDIAWLAADRQFFSKILWSPIDTTKVWSSHGTGVAYSDPPVQAFQPLTWRGQTRGIEELVATNGITLVGAPIDANAILGCWDKPIWKKSDLRSFEGQPRSPLGYTSGMDHCWQFDTASDDPDYIACASGYASNSSGFSLNRGATWSRFFPGALPSGQSGGNGGAIAVNTKAQQILIPGNNQKAIATEDGWTTWGYLDPPGTGGGNGVQGWINAMFSRRNLVTADKTRPGTFAVIMHGETTTGATQGGAAVSGLWITNNGPLTGPWTRKVAGRLDPLGDSVNFWACTLAYIPGRSGELLYVAGYSDNNNSRLLHFTNDAASGVGTPLGGASYTYKFGFGKAAPGQSYPAVFFYGTVGGVRGLYCTFDFFATAPRLIQRFVNSSLDTIVAVCGDMNILGRVYVGFTGSGWAYVDLVDKARAV